MTVCDNMLINCENTIAKISSAYTEIHMNYLLSESSQNIKQKIRNVSTNSDIVTQQLHSVLHGNILVVIFKVRQQ